jgi:hypothetical protein
LLFSIIKLKTPNFDSDKKLLIREISRAIRKMRVLTASANVGLVINRCKFVLLGVLLLHIVQTTVESGKLEEAAENFGNYTDHRNRSQNVYDVI